MFIFNLHIINDVQYLNLDLILLFFKCSLKLKSKELCYAILGVLSIIIKFCFLNKFNLLKRNDYLRKAGM